MSDTEMLSLVEYHHWTITNINDKWCVVTIGGTAMHLSLRQAIIGAMDLQRKWALNA